MILVSSEYTAGFICMNSHEVHLLYGSLALVTNSRSPLKLHGAFYSSISDGYKLRQNNAHGLYHKNANEPAGVWMFTPTVHCYECINNIKL
jgi:hypothetical protein